MEGKYLHGEPDLMVEVSISSASYDLHQKKELYLAGGVREYLVVLVKEKKVLWHRRSGKTFRLLGSQEGTYRSGIFPGLWLDAPSLFGDNMLKVIETLERGLQSPDHAAFVKQLASRRS